MTFNFLCFINTFNDFKVDATMLKINFNAFEPSQLNGMTGRPFLISIICMNSDYAKEVRLEYGVEQ